MSTNDPWISYFPVLEQACGPITQVPPDDEFVVLWQTARTNPVSLFRQEGAFEVLRLENHDDLTGILVRPEYRKIWDDIVAYYNGTAFKFETPADANEEATDDNSSDDPRDPLSRASVATIAAPVSTMDDHMISGSQVLGQWKKRLQAAVIVTGHPGIVLFQDRKDFAYIFNDHGVFSIGSHVQERILKRCLPSTTWCLVDSNERLKPVPVYITNMPLFIVQAASPRSDRMRWPRKVSNFTAMRCVMKPMTPQELIAGVSLQKPVPTVGPNVLVDFFEKYGPSTREAYKVGSNSDYVEELTEKIAQLDYPTISKMLGQTKILDLPYDGLSHKILFVRPGASRDTVRVDIITKHIFDMIHQAHLSSWRQTSSDFYRLFLETPQTRASAGYFLEDACHAMLPTGGGWAVTLLEQTSATAASVTWKMRSEPTHHLLIGRRGRALNVVTQALQGPASYARLREHVYQSKQAFKLEDAYYRPMSKNEPTLDSFIYDTGSDTITVFQITISETHSVNLKGLTWLRELKGAGKASKPAIDYVIVTPNKDDILPFTHPANKIVRDRYHLKVDHLPFPRDEGRQEEGDQGDSGRNAK